MSSPEDPHSDIGAIHRRRLQLIAELVELGRLERAVAAEENGTAEAHETSPYLVVGLASRQVMGPYTDLQIKLGMTVAWAGSADEAKLAALDVHQTDWLADGYAFLRGQSSVQAIRLQATDRLLHYVARELHGRQATGKA